MDDITQRSDDVTRASDCSPIEPLTEKVGDRIGRYKLLEEIGEGGCGMVYLAEQEAPIRRHVALKIIKRPKKNGAATTGRCVKRCYGRAGGGGALQELIPRP